MYARHWIAPVLFLLATLTSSNVLAISLGQVDTFDADELGWDQGSANNITRQATGGPNGAGDAFLQVTSSGGAGAGSKMILFNQAQWAGNYLAEGVASISLSANNLGSNPLEIRLALGDNSAPRFGGNWFASTASFSLEAGSGWVDIEFPLSATDLSQTTGTGSLDDLLANVFTLRILHSTTLSDQGQSIVATLGLDNITALSASETDPGDFNGDGIVNAADYTIWRDNLGAADDSALMGNGDGVEGIDQADYAIWVSNFGEGSGASITASSSPVPEPGAACLLASALIGLAVRRSVRR